MFLKNIIALGAFAASVAAVPMQQLDKRGVVLTTVTDVVVVTSTITTTVYGAAPATAAATAAAAPAAASPKVGSNHRQKHRKHRKAPTTTAASPAETAPAASTPYVAPSPITATPASTPTAQPSSGSSPSGSTFSGDITYYTPGLGSCGITSTDSDMIVALAEDLMEAEHAANPNTNPLCGKTITISHGGVTAQATIVDTCPGCSGDSLDLSPSLFQKFTPLATGRVSGVDWWYN